MSLKIFKDNYVEGAVITTTTENAQFPKSNILDYRTTKVYRSTACSEIIVFDLQTTESVDSIILSPDKINGFNLLSPITIEANATNEWASPAFSTTITALDSKNGVAFKLLESSEEYRFWRMSLSGTDYVELSYVYIGAKTVLDNERSISYGWSFVENDIKSERSNQYGQEFVDEIGTRKEVQFNLDAMDKNNMEKLFALFNERRTTKPFFIFIGCDNMINDSNRFKMLGKLKEKPAIVNKFFGHYYMTLTLMEQM